MHGLVLLGALAVTLPACRIKIAGEPDDGGQSDGVVNGDGGSDAEVGPHLDGAPADAEPTFACSPQSTSSPVLDGVIVIDPVDPHPGDTVTVIVRSQILDENEAPPMDLEVTSAAGVHVLGVNARAGGKALYYYAIPNVIPGDYCLLGRINGNPEIAAHFTVTPRPASPPRCEGGVYKVVTNHQWTCTEQPHWGNEIHIYVQNAAGQPLPGVIVRIDWPDTTERPIYNDTEPPAPSDIPPTVVTGADGAYHGYNAWPINVNGFMVFNLSVDGCASDVATEITTGWWETALNGCCFCYCDPATPVNTWGHWSYSVVFQLDPSASQACVVENDHAGQAPSGCAIQHIHHDPSYQACRPIP